MLGNKKQNSWGELVLPSASPKVNLSWSSHSAEVEQGYCCLGGAFISPYTAEGT